MHAPCNVDAMPMQDARCRLATMYVCTLPHGKRERARSITLGKVALHVAGNSSDSIQLIPDLFPIVPLKLPFFRGDGWGETVDPRTFCYVRTP